MSAGVDQSTAVQLVESGLAEPHLDGDRSLASDVVTHIVVAGAAVRPGREPPHPRASPPFSGRLRSHVYVNQGPIPQSARFNGKPGATRVTGATQSHAHSRRERGGRFCRAVAMDFLALMPAVSLCLSRRCFGDAFDQVQRRQHEHLFRFGLDAEEAVLLELAEDVSEQLLLGMVADGVPRGLRL